MEELMKENYQVPITKEDFEDIKEIEDTSKPDENSDQSKK